jgi:hypothetical protein
MINIILDGIWNPYYNIYLFLFMEIITIISEYLVFKLFNKLFVIGLPDYDILIITIGMNLVSAFIGSLILLSYIV